MNSREDESSRRDLRIATDIGDLTPVDWDDELAGDPTLAGRVSGLRNVERLAAAHAKLTGLPADDPSRFVGTVLLHYRIVEWIGSGRMGDVYRAQDEHLPRLVAVKIVLKERIAHQALREVLLREARIACSINHPNVATILDVGEDDRCVFVVMELVEGTTLSGLIPLPASTVVEYGIQIASALQAAHDAGVVHRDLKSANIAVTRGGLVKTLDFGIAIKVPPAPTDATAASESMYGPAGMVAGTPAYMAPELLLGRPADARGDIWALGVTLQEALTGTRPFEADSRPELELAVQRDDPTPLGGSVPTPLRRVIARCLKKDPAHRYQSAGEVRAALEAIRDSPSAPARPRIRPWTVAIGLGILILVAWLALDRPVPFPSVFGARHSILVFPARNESGIAEQQFLADGLTDQLINTFARLSSMNVKSRTTSYAVARETETLPKLAREHSFDTVLESSVTRNADRVHVNVRLVDARSDRPIWAQSYERPLREILTLDREIARDVAGSLKMRLSESEQARLAAAPPVELPVYQAYVLGRSLKAERRYERALASYSRATRLDSTFAPAYAGLADCYTEMAYYHEMPPGEALSRAAAAATRALAIDSTQGMAHLALAYVHGFQLDWPRAKTELDRAQEDEPGSPEVWYGRADYLGVHGRAPEEVKAMERAVELDPLSIRYANELGLAYLNAGRVADAANQFRRVEREGRSDEARRAHAYGARCLALQGKAAEAIEALRPPPGSPATTYEQEELAYALARAGRKSEALRTIAQLTSMGRGPASPLAIAAAQLAAGEREPAFATLFRAYADHDPRIMWLGADQRFDSIRGDPRYTTLMRNMGLGPEV